MVINCTGSNHINVFLYFLILGQHTEAVKHLVLGGANLLAKNKSGATPLDLAPFNTATWDVLNAAKNLDMPEIEEYNEVKLHLFARFNLSLSLSLTHPHTLSLSLSLSLPLLV